MRFMVIVKASRDSEAGVMPGNELLSAMGRFNEELAKAGVLLAGEGLQASSKGARIHFSGKDRSVEMGPFAEPESLVAGFWLIKTASLDEAIAWMKRCPNPQDGRSQLEIRQVFELEDFGDVPADVRESEKLLRKQQAGHN
jgi:hypothetical protein